MGGRYYYNKKSTVESSLDVSIFRLRKQGLLSGYHNTTLCWTHSQTGKESAIGLMIDMTAEEPYVQFNYTTTNKNGDSTNHNYIAYLVSRPCNLGGIRWFFACPLCGRLVCFLYNSPRETRFYCRNCSDLTYWSRNRCVTASFGHTSREIERLQKEIKRWTWRGRPTRKVRRLQALQWKMRGLSMAVDQRIDRMFGGLGGRRPDWRTAPEQ